MAKGVKRFSAETFRFQSVEALGAIYSDSQEDPNRFTQPNGPSVIQLLVLAQESEIGSRVQDKLNNEHVSVCP